MDMAKKGLTVLALTFSVAMSANAAKYEAADDSAESKLCVAAATNSKVRMHKAVKRFFASTSKASVSKNYKLIANNLYCNGVDVAEFAMQAGNQPVAEKLNKYRSEDIRIHDLAKVNHGTVNISDGK